MCTFCNVQKSQEDTVLSIFLTKKRDVVLGFELYFEIHLKQQSDTVLKQKLQQHSVQGRLVCLIKYNSTINNSWFTYYVCSMSINGQKFTTKQLIRIVLLRFLHHIEQTWTIKFIFTEKKLSNSFIVSFMNFIRSMLRALFQFNWISFLFSSSLLEASKWSKTSIYDEKTDPTTVNEITVIRTYTILSSEFEYESQYMQSCPCCALSQWTHHINYNNIKKFRIVSYGYKNIH